MKVPKAFNLAGVRWRVVRVPGLSELGLCDRDTATIRIRAGLPKQIAETTFCHELVHAIKFARGETDHDEREVDSFGAFLHQFLTTRD